VVFKAGLRPLTSKILFWVLVPRAKQGIRPTPLGGLDVPFLDPGRFWAGSYGQVDVTIVDVEIRERIMKIVAIDNFDRDWVPEHDLETGLDARTAKERCEKHNASCGPYSEWYYVVRGDSVPTRTLDALS
jgi:hypothetical protein